MGLFHLEKGRLGDLINVCKRLKAQCEEEGARLFNAQNETKRRRFPLNIRKHFFTVKVTERWHRLLREVEESPTLEIFKRLLDMVVGNWL